MAGSENSPVVRAKDTAFPKGLAEVQRAVDQTWRGSQVWGCFIVEPLPERTASAVLKSILHTDMHIPQYVVTLTDMGLALGRVRAPSMWPAISLGATGYRRMWRIASWEVPLTPGLRYTLDPGEVHAARSVEIAIGDHKFWVSADRHRDAAFRLYPRQSTTPR